ncbi:MAG: Hsp20/alpha crystallin family protein [Marinifilaceae bacterium]|jgi:HSP20 family protein|nr:Hsp20/alpha crystallin family protein [Marinifilaceae bacterium]
MNLIRYNHYRPYNSNLFTSLLKSELFNNKLINTCSGELSTASLNIKETENSYELELAAPGLDKSDFKIEYKDELLSISVDKDSKEDSSSDLYSMQEFSYSNFKRSIRVSKDHIDVENIRAEYENGILRLILTKQESDLLKARQIIVS